MIKKLLFKYFYKYFYKIKIPYRCFRSIDFRNETLFEPLPHSIHAEIYVSKEFALFSKTINFKYSFIYNKDVIFYFMSKNEALKFKLGFIK